jgi:hypothetical protein
MPEKIEAEVALCTTAEWDQGIGEGDAHGRGCCPLRRILSLNLGWEWVTANVSVRLHQTARLDFRILRSKQTKTGEHGSFAPGH